MLVLSRKLGEKIVIGDNIVITVVKIDRNQIRIGIEAPHDVPVYREEIAPERIEGRSAGSRRLIGAWWLTRAAVSRGHTLRRAASARCATSSGVRSG